ncbi:Spermine/spermidine synthase [uncultured Desulfobacterium sp.]|uniref:Spermine/spermidine synthase n=1 Tax=uncultured Desulfobacterium sp. TaxID=201089 RepID=A0A445MZR8_9BACT|nr:Spermine/spermidine synthase [uncultured Desulfobacterium sp.]
MDQRRLLIFSIISTGVTSVATQLVTIREFLTQFHGNEITISLVLFCWLLLTGIGSLAARWFRQSSIKVYPILVLTIAILPILQLLAIRGFKEAFFTHGVSPGFYQIFFYILITITPYCLLTGFILPYAQKVIIASGHEFESGTLYLTDTIGDILAGALFSFVLVYLLKPFSTIAVTSTPLILSALALLFYSRKRALLPAVFLLTLLFYYFSTNSRFEISSIAPQYGRIEQYIESPFGRIVVTKEGDQQTLWESGVPLYSGSNIIKSEEKIHYALSQFNRVEDVLLVSGGLGDTMTEVNKYRPISVDYVELDPKLTKAAEDIGIIKKRQGLNIINTDGRSYLKDTHKKYDAIILDLPEPDTFQINRFYTAEFFLLAKKALKKEGLILFSMGYNPDYLSDIWRKKFSTIYSTVSLHFRNILVLPGEEAYFLCSDRNLETDIPSLLAKKSISTSYVEGYFYGNVTAERIKRLKDCLDLSAPVNTDFDPGLISIVLRHWFMEYGASPNYFFLAVLILTITYLMFIRREEYVLFSTGLSVMGIEMLVVFAFQVVYGYIYLKIGAIVTAFLLGLLPGAIIGNRITDISKTKLIASELSVLLLLILFYLWAAFFRTGLHPVFYLIYSFFFSLVCGFQFPVAAGMIGEAKSPAAGCLAADLVGASVGTLATGTILIPIFGIKVAVISLIIIKMSSAIIASVSGKNR